MSARKAGLEVFRLFALFDANQWHILGGGRFSNHPEGTVWWEYYVFAYLVLGFTMTGLLQIGTLFSIRGRFRARGVACFWLSLIFYCRFFSFVFRQLGLPDDHTNQAMKYPITGSVSWFFTAHTLMTLTTPILHGGMLALSLRAHTYINLGIVGFILWCGPEGIFVQKRGYNWMSACFMYVFAGLFAIHGWPFGKLITWLIFIAIYGFERFLAEKDIMSFFPAKWGWAFITFRMRSVPIKRNVGFGAPPGGAMQYVFPLSYFWGVVALYGFSSVELPTGLSKMINFLSVKGFTLHLLDRLPLMNRQIQNWNRPHERIATPWLSTKNALLHTTQLSNLGFILEVFRVPLFSIISDIIGRFIGYIADFYAIISKRNSQDPTLDQRKESG
jgi:hypothetical protein